MLWLFACTSASIVIGEEKVSGLLTEGRGNIPTTNPWTAAKAAFNHLRAKKVAVFSPYPTDVNFPLRQQLIDADFEVVALTALGIMDDNIIHKVPLSTFEQGIEILLKDTGAEVIFMSCTSLRAVDNIQYLEDKYGVPIVFKQTQLYSGIQCIFCGKSRLLPRLWKIIKWYSFDIADKCFF